MSRLKKLKSFEKTILSCKLQVESFARCRFSIMARQKLPKKRSLHRVNEHFEAIFNAAMVGKMLRAKLSNYHFAFGIL
jgi:hypothetical protein